MKVISLGSGSKGNCMLVTNGKNSVLIDVGISFRSICQKLEEVGKRPEEIDAVLITHEHGDHIRSVKEIAPYIPLYSHADTLEASGCGMMFSFKRCFDIDEKGFSLGSMDIQPFRISHDAVHPFGYVIKDETDSVCYLTDTGYIGKGIFKTCLGCKQIILESNYDKELLTLGEYPDYLKMRILSDKGHLCNQETALASRDFVKAGAKKILLSHISENNNLAELAYWTTSNFLDREGVDRQDVTLKVASQKGTVVL